MKLSDPLSAASSLAWPWKLASAVLGWMAAFAAPVQPFMILVLVLVVVDVITGIWAARRNGERITSKEMGRTVPKVVLYPVAILLSEAMVHTFFAGTPVVSSLTYMVALFICTIEFQSNIENIGKLTGTDIWVHIREYLKRKQN